MLCSMCTLSHSLLLQLFDIIVRYDTLRFLISSLIRNGSSIILTFILGIVLIYIYSIWSYLMFSGDFLVMTNPIAHIQSCSEDWSSQTCQAGLTVRIR